MKRRIEQFLLLRPRSRVAPQVSAIVDRTPRLLAGLLIAAALLLEGCSLAPSTRSAEATFDFGPPPQSATRPLPGTFRVDDASAPAWLDSPTMHYRLNYSGPLQVRSYANSRWAMSPAALLTQRLRTRIAQSSRGAYSSADGVRADVSVLIDLDEFAQVFDSPDTSRGVIRIRVSASSTGQQATQKLFDVESRAPSPDAPGGAAALIAASDEAIRQIVEWLGNR